MRENTAILCRRIPASGIFRVLCEAEMNYLLHAVVTRGERVAIGAPASPANDPAEGDLVARRISVKLELWLATGNNIAD